jgi:hypothetical protein
VEETQNAQKERVYIVTLHEQAGPKRHLRFLYEFNADRGFLITGTKGYTPDGDLFKETRVKVDLIDGVWVPIEISDIDYRAGIKNEPKETRQRVRDSQLIKCTYRGINKPIEPGTFDLPKLGMPAGIDILTIDKTGKQRTWIWMKQKD